MFVEANKNMEELEFPDFYKDIYLLFFDNLASNLERITDDLTNKLKLRFPNRKIY